MNDNRYILRECFNLCHFYMPHTSTKPGHKSRKKGSLKMWAQKKFFDGIDEKYATRPPKKCFLEVCAKHTAEQLCMYYNDLYVVML